MMKSLLTAAAIATAAAGFTASAAHAGKVHVDVGIGLGVFDPGYGYGYGGYPVYPVYGDGGYHSWGVSCGEARMEVKSAHFKKVKALDCSGKTYTFSGWKFGDKYRIKVSRKSGEIISVSALW